MKQIFFTIGVLMGSLWLFSACSGDEGSVGEELLGTSKVNVTFSKNQDIAVLSKKDNESDLSGVSTFLLGTLNDNIFGKTSSGAAFQLRLPGPLRLKNPSIDSVKLFLEYENYYGKDTTKMQTARVYLLKDDIQYGKVYNAAFKISSVLGEQVGHTSFHKNLVSDTIYLKSKVDATKDSVVNSKKVISKIIRHLVVKLDNNKVGQFILNGTKEIFEGSDNFVQYFKGLYVKTDDFSDSQGCIYGFNVYKSYLKIYYKNYREIENKEDAIYTTSFSFPITDNSARFNTPSFSHPENLLSNDSYIYLQGIHGTKAQVQISELATWKDSTRVTINKAELIFNVAVDNVEAEKYKLPYRLALSAVDEEGKRRFLNYSSYLGNLPNGLLNLKQRTYSFHIPEYLQEIVNGKEKYKYFELSVSSIENRVINRKSVYYPVDTKNAAARVRLHNDGKYKPTLNITYTKY